jgi:hypothetical protein
MRLKLILIGAGIGILIIGGVLWSAYHSGGPGAADNPVTTGPGPSISSSDSAPIPAFTNEEVLTDIGVTSDQVTNMEQALEQYLSSINATPGTVSFDSVRQISVNKNAVTPIWTIGFTVQLDDNSAYSAKMDYFSLTGIRLYLYSPDGSQLLYDSQDVGGSPNSL